MNGKSILLIIGGGIAAYKSLDLIRRARERGARVRAVLTSAAQQFVTPLSVSTLAEEKAYTELFDLKDETEIGHIRLSREADIIIIAPATANLLAQMANGLAGDLATSVLLAANKPILAAPAMNWKMWEYPATQRNIAQLRADGVHFAGPTEGAMACNEWGVGRMAEPLDILAAADLVLRDASQMPLQGMHVLVTAGPTHEAIDPVRYIANKSSGKQGYAIAAAAANLGARVTLVSGPVTEIAPARTDLIKVTTAREMLDAARDALPADIAIFIAAVADWRVSGKNTQKIKKLGKGEPPTPTLTENPDILRTIAKHRSLRPPLVIGFAAETEHVVSYAQKKLAAKGCDWIVANDVSERTGIMGGADNEVHLITPDGVEDWPPMSKIHVAEALMQRAVEFLRKSGPQIKAAAE
jgi:phosphopantothenoylcysteine decarboxylase/phosphopantothenate--cysteine ligase